MTLPVHQQMCRVTNAHHQDHNWNEARDHRHGLPEGRHDREGHDVRRDHRREAYEHTTHVAKEAIENDKEEDDSTAEKTGLVDLQQFGHLSTKDRRPGERPPGTEVHVLETLLQARLGRPPTLVGIEVFRQH